MKTKTGFLALAVLLVAVVAAIAAQDPNMGTWNLDEAKSKLSGAKNTKVVYEAAGDSVKVIVDGVDKDGKATHNEWTGKFDGKDYALTGDPAADMRSYKKINAHTLALTNKKDGKVTLSGKITVSADGKTRTVTISGKDSSGKKISTSSYYNKE